LIKNSQPFGKKFQKTEGGFCDSRCMLQNQQIITDTNGMSYKTVHKTT